ncbi:HAMP domain-containing histidine kinase [Gramella jeungdoensis]|uniref:histidine kinase n=1 Tax=Gramella jeungdoensis TaxID=708091 RepID=A0ABT0Z596_9FLAO|nr:HAMP domain-containing sensor histidine kinase [Gramella jeungdoensis]MCM8570598.1 HAMP domain-containing histidine kinase [Gramella jeungdoensis]
MKRAAEIIKQNSSRIMDDWECSVKREIEASNISSLAVRNQLPNLLDDISEIMTRYDGFEGIQKHEEYREIIKNSLDHGRHRATSSHYTVKQILKEYVVFHRVLTEILIENDVYTKEVGIILKYTLETAMLNSASSFSDSLQEMREKLVGTLAHDIRTPISTAYFALDILRCSDSEERFHKLKKMGLKSLEKSLELLEGLLDAISVQAGEGITLNFEKIDLVKELKWVYNEASQIYTNEIGFRCKPKKITGIFDGTAVRRVVENLVTNAVKYGSHSTPVTITVEDEEDQVIISVHNYGKPIARKNQSDIFKFLKRGRDVNSGNLESWGMGLTLVKSVAEAHGGKVGLQSDEEHGTTFSISLMKNANSPGKIRTELNYSEN